METTILGLCRHYIWVYIGIMERGIKRLGVPVQALGV